MSAYQTPQPEAVMFLGDGNTREPFAAQLAAQNLNLQVWVSSRLRPAQVKQFFLAQNIALNRVNLDYHATDTVTNFTTLVDNLQAENVRHIYLRLADSIH
ncbi:YdcF family protein [Leptolyngbya cf. ectocarpi LEGE 11479]|uniref:YdcF family protein n=1 Tax=Leptolyngbya cf. ectocarpi LEGE 11479 TaxID=1828722 RepID=A0A928ZUV0_LEPEC|nr:YdcF family protein [Leptolyngbya ectocarpi]MBE9067876.1 YdcF family protein [Leptolyngbya cf. ectocarpi LEGE 11479]